MKEQLSRGSCRIDGLAEHRNEIDEITERSALSIELLGDDDITRTREAEHLVTFRHKTGSGRELLLENPLAPSVEQRVAL